MPNTASNTAKLFSVEGGQAVLLPKEYGDFLGTEVSIRRDPQTNDVILSPKSEPPPTSDSWQGFFDLLKSTTIPENFMDDRKQPASPRNPFEGWVE